MRSKRLFQVNNTYEGKSIEQEIAERMEGNNIELGGKALLYTEKKDGVLPETDIRSDKFELAMIAKDKVERMRIVKKDNIGKDVGKDNVGKTEPTPGEAK